MLKQAPAYLVALSCLYMVGCASYSSNTKKGLDAFTSRDFSTAESIYKEGAEKEGIDQLLFLFDRGIVRHNAGQFAESNRDLLLADKLSEIKDYTALAAELGAILTSERNLPYKGEEFENVLVSTYSAINFALMGKAEDAIVECRRVNRKLERLRSEGKRDYRLNAFAQYLSGILYEKEGNWNSAYVDYRKTYDIEPGLRHLRSDLIRGAVEQRSESEKDRWERKFGATKEEFQAARASLAKDGFIVVIYQNGFAPEKVPSAQWYEIPVYQKRYNKHSLANIYIDGQKVGATEIAYDIEAAAIKNLESKYAGLIAKRIAGVAAREVIGNQIGKATNSDLLGAAAKVLLYASGQADTRAWQTLPRNLQIARIARAPGKYRIELKLVMENGQEETNFRTLGEVEIKKPGEISLLNYRSLND